ncbi:FHA domain-containing protein [Pseudomaricurvus sp. HS19]|uniref:FHA domain-containing protein n=1 Tax=Pseudomaricurvus sp. HS19 TaxID=2692626 RepID=UPI001370422A|nr:FHA domain-containing protein [Pseudomaricurvus sp. HS19]MYM64775.1 hypothetical protein [Pseudomaricurvus sp. HS19]
MAYRLGPDGKPQEVKSSYNKDDVGTQPPRPRNEEATIPPPRNKQASQEPDTQPPNRSGGAGLFAHVDDGTNHKTAPRKATADVRPKNISGGEEPETRPARKSGLFDHVQGNPPPAPAPLPGEPRTQIAMGSRMQSAGNTAELVCGWLVIIDGPGKGSSLVVGPGQSIVSRSPEQRICLNFGDDTITSKEQLRIIFDDEEREFFISPGNGSSLNRLNGQVVGSQMLLNSGDTLKVGKTTLRFVAFCDKSFCWE